MESLIILVGLLIIANASLGSNFSYDGNGPNSWGDKCLGKHQSPINIEEHIVENSSFPILNFSGFDELRVANISNNGHTVMLKMEDSETALVSGGPLRQDKYVFEQLHFHWGANDHEGSEDLINNHSFAMELHAVFYKQAYGSMEAAVDHPDGLTVLAYFFEASEEDNPTYDEIVQSLSNVEGVGSKTKLPEQLKIQPILIPNSLAMQNYFTYNGSLTTPPCFEVVTWIDFKEPLLLSHDQIAAFRNVRSPEGVKLTHNFRPIQPLEDRIVYHNIPDEENIIQQSDSQRSEGSRMEISFATAFGILLLTTPPEIITNIFSIFELFS